MLKYFILFIFFSMTLLGSYLKGRIIAFSSNGEEYGKEGLTLSIPYEDNPKKSIKNGFFRLYLPDNYTAGTKVRLMIDNPNWFIYSPNNGQFFLPKNLEDFDLEVKVVTNTSKIKNKYFDVSISSKQTQGKISQPVIQIASFKNESSAKKVLKDIKRKRYSKAFIEKINSQYKVFISIFKTKKEANKFLKFFTKKYRKQYGDAFVTLIATHRK